MLRLLCQVWRKRYVTFAPKLQALIYDIRKRCSECDLHQEEVTKHHKRAQYILLPSFAIILLENRSNKMPGLQPTIFILYLSHCCCTVSSWPWVMEEKVFDLFVFLYLVSTFATLTSSDARCDCGLVFCTFYTLLVIIITNMLAM